MRNKCSIAAAALARCLLVYWCHKFPTLIALSRNSSALLPLAAGGLVSYIASLFLLKRLCASNYVYFASKDVISGSRKGEAVLGSPLILADRTQIFEHRTALGLAKYARKTLIYHILASR